MHAALSVDRGDLELRGGQRRLVERSHGSLAVECPPDDDLRRLRTPTARSPPGHCRSGRARALRQPRQPPTSLDLSSTASSWVRPLGGLHGTGRYLVNRRSDSRLPHAFEGSRARGGQLLGGPVPQGVRPCVPEAPVVGKDLEVVEAVPAGSARARRESQAGRRRRLPGRTRSAQLRVGSRQSAMCTPTKRSHVRCDLLERHLACSRDASVSNWIPSAGWSASSSSSTASPQRRDHRPVLAADAVDRLEPDAHAGALRLRRRSCAGRRRRCRGRRPAP